MHVTSSKQMRPFYAATASRARLCCRARSSAERSGSNNLITCDRRELLAAVGSIPFLVPSVARAAGQSPRVGTYLPATDAAGFVLFVPDKKKTPALRAGTVDPESPYRFMIPEDMREAKVANIQSGNYCQPRCAEPWTEVIFESEETGRLQVIVSPLVRLTNRATAAIQDIGPPEGLLTSLGPFITGTYLDEEDIVSVSSKKQDDGRTYYYYELNASYGSVGPHTLSAATTKGDLALLFVAAATDKQWARSRATLQTAVDSFRA